MWNDVCLFKVRCCTSVLRLVLGEQVEVFAQGAGELRHLFAAMVGRAWSVALPLFDTSVDLKECMVIF